MATRLQKRFSTGKIKRLYAGIMMNDMAMQGVRVRRTKRLFNKIAAKVMIGMSEPMIVYMLLDLLQCYDVGPAEKAEAVKLLQMAEMPLTAEQVKQIDRKLRQ